MDEIEGHETCRLREFLQWNRLFLEHEREHLSRAMSGAAFISYEEQCLIVHDVSDIDWVLAQPTWKGQS